MAIQLTGFPRSQARSGVLILWVLAHGVNDGQTFFTRLRASHKPYKIRRGTELYLASHFMNESFAYRVTWTVRNLRAGEDLPIAISKNKTDVVSVTLLFAAELTCKCLANFFGVEGSHLTKRLYQLTETLQFGTQCSGKLVLVSLQELELVDEHSYKAFKRDRPVRIVMKDAGGRLGNNESCIVAFHLD